MMHNSHNSTTNKNDSSENVGGDSFMGQTTFNLAKNKLPFRGNLYLGSEKGEVNKKITGYLDVKVEVLKNE